MRIAHSFLFIQRFASCVDKYFTFNGARCQGKKSKVDKIGPECQAAFYSISQIADRKVPEPKRREGTRRLEGRELLGPVGTATHRRVGGAAAR